MAVEKMSKPFVSTKRWTNHFHLFLFLSFIFICGFLTHLGAYLILGPYSQLLFEDGRG